MPRRLVALSTSAIATIYFAGFVATRSADAGIASTASEASGASAAPTLSTTTAPTASSTSVPTPVVGASAQSTTTSTTSTANTSATAAYRDGTYTGSGTSRRGGVNVSVTVQNGQITNVQITSVSTEYPVSRIASLPAQVISKQSAQVNTISGATYSTQAFVQAVQQALSKAT